MKSKLPIITTVFALVLCCASSQAQNKQHPITSPPSIGGDSVLCEEDDSNISLDLIVPDASGFNYICIPIYNSDADAGSCSYTNSTDIGIIITTNQTKGKSEEITLTFTNSNGGTCSYSLPIHGGSGFGWFKIALGTAPTSVAGDTFLCSANSGNFGLSISTSGTQYTISGSNGVINGTGTCSITNLNKSTLCAQLTDSTSGALSHAYFCFYNTNSGFYAITQTNGGYCVGDFTLTNTPALPPFFAESVALGNDWYYLSTGSNHLFGYYSMASFPYIYHDDMGWEYFMDATNANSGAYFYDFTDSAWFYSEPGLFPYLYDFNLNHWMWYEPEPGTTDHYTSNPRWFYDITAGAWTNDL